MPEIKGIEKLFSLLAKKKFGGFSQYGTSQYGWSHYGDDDVYILKGTPQEILLSGIFRTDQVTGETKNYREPFYITRNSRYVPQQAWRQKFADGMAAWKALTPEEKLVYYERAKKLRITGHNLFMREYLKSN